MEEPELHLPPGTQRRLVAQAVSIAEQTVCTSHSPRVAAYYPATSVQILERRPERLASSPLLLHPLDASASNARRKLYHDDRPRVLEALMQHRVLIPEGRSEYEWFRLLCEVLETGEQALQVSELDSPSFGTVVGVVPTHDAAVAEIFSALRRARAGLLPLVDGDTAGDEKVKELQALESVPPLILQWRDGWMMEDAIGWILKGAEEAAADALRDRIDRDFETIDDLMALFKVKEGPGRLKTDYLAYEEVASVIGIHAECRRRTAALLEAVMKACLGQTDDCDLIACDEEKSNEQSVLIRLTP